MVGTSGWDGNDLELIVVVHFFSIFVFIWCFDSHITIIVSSCLLSFFIFASPANCCVWFARESSYVLHSPALPTSPRPAPSCACSGFPPAATCADVSVELILPSLFSFLFRD